MQDSFAEPLKTARENLLIATKLSCQGSYNRRAPSPECLPHYDEVKRVLRDILQQDPNNREALLMMYQVHEGLMDFGKAIEYLGEAFEAGEPKTKKLLKKLSLLRENAQEWKNLILSPAMLRDLGEYLESMGVGPASRSMDFTREWLLLNFDGDPEEVLTALDERGAFSDFQVLANVVYG